MSELKVYRVDDGGECVWAIADDPEKARAISRAYMRDSEHPENYEDEDEVIMELAMDAPLTIAEEDGRGPYKKTQTCAEWIKECGEGFLATTCF